MIAKFVCLMSLVFGFIQAGQLPTTPYDKHWKRQCASNEYLSYIKSRHDYYKEDRAWEFTCSPSGVTLSDCHWTGYQNDYDRRLDYTCKNGIINGLESVHHNYYEDRKWSMYCCKMNKAPKACFETNQLNQYDKLLSTSISSGYFFSGIWSEHSNHYDDRIFKFKICRF